MDVKDVMTTEEVLNAYVHGYFPMAHPEEDNEIYWHRPLKRGIIPLDKFRPGRNLRRLYNKEVFDLHINKDFEAVMRGCADRSSTWISEDIISIYIELHEKGFVHSFEAWKDGKLAGGLYGVAIGRAFFGESMFHRITDASKIALVFLVEYLRSHEFKLLDTQYLNDHIRRFGGIEIPDEEYQELLRSAILEEQEESGSK